MNIGKRISELRTEAGLTQSDLAKRIGCSGQVISNIERGYTSPAVDLVRRIAECLGVSSDFLLDNVTKYDIQLSNEEKEMILRYRKLTPKEKRIFLGVLNVTLDKTE